MSIPFLKLASIGALLVLMEACSAQHNDTDQQPEPTNEPSHAASPSAAVAAEPPASPVAPTPAPKDSNGCQLIQAPGHFENPGTLGSRWVPGPVLRICDQPPIVVAPRANERPVVPVAPDWAPSQQ